MNEDEMTPEQKKQAAIELANSYREMMGHFAWKHFKTVILQRIREDSIKSVDEVPPELLTPALVGVSRGVRKCIDQIDSELGWILNSQETKK